MEHFLGIGLMSGTSMDGIDVSLIESDGKTYVKEVGNASFQYDRDFQFLLKAAEFAVFSCQGDLTEANRRFNPLLRTYIQQELNRADPEITVRQLAYYLYYRRNKNAIHFYDITKRSTELHAQAVQHLLHLHKIKASKVDVIGYHGQTLYHNPAKQMTVQIGDGALLSKMTEIPVVNNFRANDVKHGGQGAPFAPLYHHALAVRDKLCPVAIVNCGGIANITAVLSEKVDDVVAFDSGPGNGLIDAFVRLRTGGRETMDWNGLYGYKGAVHMPLVKALYEKSCALNGENYYLKPPPKSLDIRDINMLPELSALSLEDGCATLASFTAKTIVDGLALVNGSNIISQCILAGGGWRNPVIMREFKHHMSKHHHRIDHVRLAKEVGWDDKALEAQIFAYLAIRRLQELPLSLPKTTGVKEPVTGGDVYA